MPLIRKKLIVMNEQGLHARPAALFVQIANKYIAKIVVKHDNEIVDGKSIMGILMLGAEKGSAILLEADGPDAQSAVDELEQVILMNESKND